jgi:hypothetical protein
VFDAGQGYKSISSKTAGGNNLEAYSPRNPKSGVFKLGLFDANNIGCAMTTIAREQTVPTTPTTSLPGSDVNNFVDLACGIRSSATALTLANDGIIDARLDMGTMTIKVAFHATPLNIVSLSASPEVESIIRNAKAGDTITLPYSNDFNFVQLTVPSDVASHPITVYLTRNGAYSIGLSIWDDQGRISGDQGTAYVEPNSRIIDFGAINPSRTQIYYSIDSNPFKLLDLSKIDVDHQMEIVDLGDGFDSQSVFVSGGWQGSGNTRTSTFDANGFGCTSVIHSK